MSPGRLQGREILKERKLTNVGKGRHKLVVSVMDYHPIIVC